ncbi:MAG: hypothetical protein OEY96_14215 [Gammaproteobacteria bacterium]|nr:hypothetical protein [Gammaproteobacteria bacterium]
MKMLKILGFISLLVSTSLNAEEWQIAEYLTIEPADSIDVTFQEIPELEMEGEFVAGWKGEDMSYFLVLDAESGEIDESEYWPALIKEMAGKKAKYKDVIIAEGKFKTRSGNQVSHKTIRYSMDGEQVVQLFTLVKSKKMTYWIVATSVDEDIKYMTENTIAILKTATITR